MVLSEHNGRYTYINKTTVANEQLIVDSLFDRTFTSPYVKKMTISVGAECTVVINGLDEILIKPNLGLSIEYTDRGIHSMVCKTPNVAFYAIIGY